MKVRFRRQIPNPHFKGGCRSSRIGPLPRPILIIHLSILEEFAQLIEHWEPTEAEVEILDPSDWNRQGQYDDIIEAVKKAGKSSDVRVYRVAKGGVRYEYWVVATEGKGKKAKLVGLKALAVES